MIRFRETGRHYGGTVPISTHDSRRLSCGARRRPVRAGFRLVESLTLSWDPDSPFFVDLSGKHPRFRIYAEAEKGNRDRLLPITPDFAEWLLQTPEEHRHGRVFRIVGLNTGKPITDKRVTKILTRIGKRAGVVVNRETRKVRQNVIDPRTGEPTGKTRLVEEQVTKYASAHDLRRAFGTRWAKRVMPARESTETLEG